MKNCNSILSIHEGMGTTQKERLRPALQTDFFLLDERKEEDFILFVQRLSKYVKFYNELDIHDGDWSSFFQKESTSILIYIASWNIEILQNSFEIKKNEILINSVFNTQKELLDAYFKELKAEFQEFIMRAEALDNEIIEKENLLSSKDVINAKFDLIINQIEAVKNVKTDQIPNIHSLLKNYAFVNARQQLFGLLLSWKNFAQNAVANQLENYSKHSPHYTLFLTFLKLLAVAKEKYNEFTKKHLDFYYKDVLKIQNKKAAPDYVHLIAEPFSVKPFLIPKDTIFSAGKNGNGKNKFYAATADQTVNQIKLNSFYSHFCKDKHFYKTIDLLDVNAKGKGFDVFTNHKQDYQEGIMIASPILFLQSGERIIFLKFNTTSYPANSFKFYITGEKEGIEITQKSDSNGFVVLTIPATEKAIVPFDSKIHKDFLVQTAFPVLKIIAQSNEIITSISTIEMTVQVNDFKSFVLESDFGVIDVEKPFYPFGEFPKNGNGMNLGSNEFFMKNKAVATIGITAFNSESNWFDSRVVISQLNNGKWIEEPEVSLASITNTHPLNEYHFDAIVSNEFVTNGKIRIELDDTAYADEKYMQDFIKATTSSTTSTASPPVTTATTTKTVPYKPRIKAFAFNYTVSETINLATRSNENNPIELFKVLPYGSAKSEKANINFSALTENEGVVYIGFDSVEPHDSLNFLIQLEEGTANPLLEPATISWQYLSKNEWIDFNENEIGDETYSLTQSGLIAINVPEFDASSNTKLDKAIFWVRISVSNNQAICKFIGVHAQAFKAVLVDFENIGTEFLENTPKETISKAYKAINGVKKIIQPYASFLGRIAEPDNALYTRTSERLRHKNRAITSWDYERIILEEFPEVYRIKTLNHYRFDTQISNVAAGYVTLIPIAQASTSENISWKPLLSLNKMLLIKAHLSKKASPQVRINVKPPVLEKVEIQFKVKFHFVPGMDNRLYIDQLMATINRYLSPWAFEEEDFIFASEIEFSSIIQLVDNQSYVDYITDFKVNQYQLDANNEIVGSAIQNLNKIAPQSDFTLFIPNEAHQIIEI